MKKPKLRMEIWSFWYDKKDRLIARDYQMVGAHQPKRPKKKAAKRAA